jgi:hypothetical protein
MTTLFNDWRCRCSALSRIATSLNQGLTEKQRETLADLSSRTKPITEKQRETLLALRQKEAAALNPRLPQGVKTFLREEWIRIVHKRNREIRSKYLEKGTTMEEDALTLVSEVENELFVKNREELGNEFLTGTPDHIQWGTDGVMEFVNTIDDTKCSWDIYTYYAAVDKADAEDEEEYKYQIQGYCALTGAPIGRIRRCLVDTPFNLLEQEKKTLYFRLGIIDPDGPDDASAAYRAGCEEIDRSGTYDDIPAVARVHTRVIQRDDALIELLYDRIKECRKYLNKIHQEYLNKTGEACHD